MGNWGPALLYLIGSGAIWKLIELFFKRYDGKKRELKEYYGIIYKKLCDYNSQLVDIVLASVKNDYQILNKISTQNNVTEERLAEIDKIKATIKRQERKCKKQKADEETCYKCQQSREHLTQLIDKLQIEHQLSKDLSKELSNYWEDNSNEVYSMISTNMNIHNYMLAKNVKDKKLYNAIQNIDTFSLQIMKSICMSRNELPNILITQMENIEHALILLSKKM